MTQPIQRSSFSSRQSPGVASTGDPSASAPIPFLSSLPTFPSAASTRPLFPCFQLPQHKTQPVLRTQLTHSRASRAQPGRPRKRPCDITPYPAMPCVPAVVAAGAGAGRAGRAGLVARGIAGYAAAQRCGDVRRASEAADSR